ncbi:uncharacterized protein MEPE_03347 [Melanopsichium pennsylvanicum]|uniref:Endonuclease/exonuclease/phosphatase domain-containing protein n=1 Tax=Melanopsichium pennsylvanicum TaxID=63383 RepID=A0AAJ4XP75_9BASI|nr:uncharacterized protein MEPE_03347 [Melanopsichium pennsylvanicum]
MGCVYVPADSTDRSDWLENTTEFLVSLRSRLQCDIVGGDWNMVLNAMDLTSTRRPNLRERHRLLTFLSCLNAETDGLIDGYRVQNPETIMYTHTSHNSQARLDRIYVVPDLLTDTYEWETQVPPNSLNLDHHMVTVKLKPLTQVERGPGRFRFKCSLMKSKSVQQCLDWFVENLKKEPVCPERWATLKTRLEISLAKIVKAKVKALTQKRV